MTTFIDRLKIEGEELGEKISKLQGFNGTVIFNGLSTDEKFMLEDQLGAMLEYQRFLTKRINFYLKA